MCEKNRARTNLLKQDEKLGRFTSGVYICHTKAMTALVEYGTRWCFNSGQNFKTQVSAS